MSTVRGFAVGTLTLIALEVLSTRAGAADSVFAGATNLFRSFLAPNVPAIHYKGHWGTGGATSSTAPNKHIAPIGLAPPGPPGLIVGINKVTPQAPVNA